MIRKVEGVLTLQLLSLLALFALGTAVLFLTRFLMRRRIDHHHQAQA